MSKTSDYKHYIGDINLKYGGFFADLDNWCWVYADVLRVTDLDSGCGFRGAVMVERLTALGWDSKYKVKQALSYYGYDKIPSAINDANSRKMLIIDAMLSYGYYDPNEAWDNYRRGYTLIIQTDSDEDYAPMEYDGWRADVRLEENQDLLEYLESEGYLQDFE